MYPQMPKSSRLPRIQASKAVGSLLTPPFISKVFLKCLLNVCTSVSTETAAEAEKEADGESHSLV